MLKVLHSLFIFASVGSFIGRFALTYIKPELLQQRWLKIAPHIIDTFLLLSGLALVFQGNWLNGEYGWIISKLILLIAYIVCGVVAMRSSGPRRWLAFIAAMLCFAAILAVAISKHGFF
jgi:uncharacterized membrane protein SirB2